MYRMYPNHNFAARQRHELYKQNCQVQRHTSPRESLVTDENCRCEHVTENVPATCNTYETSDFNYTLAMVYSNVQEWQNLYCEDKGFLAGTIFMELDKPFYGPKCHGGICNE